MYIHKYNFYSEPAPTDSDWLRTQKAHKVVTTLR